MAATSEGRLFAYDYASGTPTAVDCTELPHNAVTRIDATALGNGRYTVSFPDNNLRSECDATGQYSSDDRLTYAQFVDPSAGGPPKDIWIDDFFGSQIPVD